MMKVIKGENTFVMITVINPTHRIKSHRIIVVHCISSFIKSSHVDVADILLSSHYCR